MQHELIRLGANLADFMTVHSKHEPYHLFTGFFGPNRERMQKIYNDGIYTLKLNNHFTFSPATSVPRGSKAADLDGCLPVWTGRTDIKATKGNGASVWIRIFSANYDQPGERGTVFMRSISQHGQFYLNHSVMEEPYYTFGYMPGTGDANDRAYQIGEACYDLCNCQYNFWPSSDYAAKHIRSEILPWVMGEKYNQ